MFANRNEVLKLNVPDRAAALAQRLADLETAEKLLSLSGPRMDVPAYGLLFGRTLPVRRVPLQRNRHVAFGNVHAAARATELLMETGECDIVGGTK